MKRTIKIPKVDTIKSINQVYGGSFPFSSDALLIKQDFSTNGMIETVNSTSRSMPIGVEHAFKITLQYDSNNIIVILFEVYPYHGRRWTNLYAKTSGAWRGWNKVDTTI